MSAARPWSQAACDLWTDRFGGTAPGGRIGKALKPLIEKYGEQKVLAAWMAYLVQTPADYANPQSFASKFGVYVGERAGRLTAGQSAKLAALGFLSEGEAPA